MTEFVQITSFPDTPQYVTALFIGLLAIYILKAGLEVIARVNKFIILLIIFIIGITLVMVVPKANINNFLPLLKYGWSPVLKDANKIYVKGILIGSIILLASIIRNILVMGFPSLTLSIFPSYDAVSLINIGKFIRGVEIIIAINITIAGFIKVTICLLASSIGISRLFNFSDYKWVAAPLGLLMMSLSFILYHSTMHMIEWIDVYKYYAFPFQVILPIIILIFGKIKKGKKSKSLL